MINQNAKHTPGPWRIGDAGNTIFGPDKGEILPEIVASVKGGTCNQSAISRCYTMQANARLIAAAPEMLDAMKSAVEIIRESFGDSPGEESDCQAVILLEEAINKAEGRI